MYIFYKIDRAHCVNGLLSKGAESIEHRVRQQGLLVVFSIHREVGKSRCPSAQWLPSGSGGAGQPQTQEPKWCDKRCAGSPSPPG